MKKEDNESNMKTCVENIIFDVRHPKFIIKTPEKRPFIQSIAIKQRLAKEEYERMKQHEDEISDTIMTPIKPSSS